MKLFRNGFDVVFQVCEQIPVPSIAYIKEVECQKCQKYTVAVPATKLSIECNPVYDEKCHTSYPKHCAVETRCHELYQTVCQTSYDGYGQNCGSEPRQHCYPETKCHRTPMTECRPVQREKCVKVPKEVVEQRVEKQCLPFEISQGERDAMNHIDPCTGGVLGRLLIHLLYTSLLVFSRKKKPPFFKRKTYETLLFFE